MAFIPHKVFTDRHQRIREHLDAEGLEALIVTTPGNFFMLSGFHLDVEPWERPVAAVIPRNGEPFLIMNALSTNHLKMAEANGSLVIRDRSIYAEHPRTRNRTYTRRQWAELLDLRLREQGIDRGRIGVEGSGPSELLLANPRLSFEDMTPFLEVMRMVKAPEELDVMRQCAPLTDFGQDRYMEWVKPGEVVAAFDARVAQAIYEEGAKRFPKDRLEAFVFSLSGPASAAPHGTGADCGAKFEKGHGVVNIIVCALNGLTVENERTLFLGQPSDEQKRAYEAATAACEAAAAQMVAGNRVSSADEAAQAVIEAAGYGDNILHRTGHGMGIAGHEFPDDMPFLHRPFWEREVYSAEPGIYIYGLGGFRHDDTVIVGAKKPEVITRRSKKLEDQIVSV